MITHIVSKTDGVPLFVEELTKMLLESGFLRAEANRYVLTGPLSALTIPDTLQDSLMARLDRLPGGREVAQLGAVLGREFSYDMLLALASLSETDLQDRLAQLVEAELLYQRGRPPLARYMFKHALIQDAAYASLLNHTRQKLHQQVAQLLEAQYPEVVELQPELLAHHHTEANQPESAILYWQWAGQQAHKRSTNSEAIGHLTEGLSLLSALPKTPERVQQELDMQLTLGAALSVTKGFTLSEVEAVYRRAQVLCEQIDDAAQRLNILFGFYLYSIVGGAFQTAHELAEQMLQLAQEQDDPVEIRAAYMGIGQVQFVLGDLPIAHRNLTQGPIPEAPEQLVASTWPGAHPEVRGPLFDALVVWLLGMPDQARALVKQALINARALAHPFSLAFALTWAPRLYIWCGENLTVQTLTDELVALSEKQSFALWAAQGMTFRGWLQITQGGGDEGLTLLRQGAEAYRNIGARLELPTNLALLAEASLSLGQATVGYEALNEAFAVVAHSERHYWESELHRLRGELLIHAEGDCHLADLKPEACFEQALDISRRQQAKSLELRAAMSLARLWQSQDKRQEAYDLLAPVYGWFTEGFDTADLIDARELLDDLGGSRS